MLANSLNSEEAMLIELAGSQGMSVVSKGRAGVSYSYDDELLVISPDGEHQLSPVSTLDGELEGDDLYRQIVNYMRGDEDPDPHRYLKMNFKDHIDQDDELHALAPPLRPRGPLKSDAEKCMGLSNRDPRKNKGKWMYYRDDISHVFKNLDGGWMRSDGNTVLLHREGKRSRGKVLT